ncbi:hypothetical protein DL764_000290 [Monosporascus ibericus]|uniref:Uncharacterized protein n=1 Tax=Monosporascus ibericus TaxID=155417 RepID=A0A4Q4TZA2_9PEZI|nr:hypothetical protein DL764_000290 [Monosporascus ibericus]
MAYAGGFLAPRPSARTTSCGHCKGQGKACIAPTGALKARAINLVAAMAANPGAPSVQQAVKAAQAAVKKAFEGKKADAAMPTAKKGEADAVMPTAKKGEADTAATAERQESKRLSAERLAAAAERSAKAADDAADYAAELVAEQKRAADALEGIQKGLVTLQELYRKANADALQAPSRRGSTPLPNDEEENMEE